ncbi:MAG: hypothetical protein OXT69_10170 [Candidatus Poribacteria bacterium]|nr:hypothetical protein [Candidatus Poribacteria bacterium]
MKQQDKRAFWLILAGVGMAAAAVFMFLAAERLRKSGTDKKQTAEQTLNPSPAPVEVKPIVQPLPSLPKKTPPPAVRRADEPPVELPMKPSPRYVYVEDPIEKAARDYDASGQVGDPPAGWKEDYSHWDSENWGMPVEKLGMLYPDGKLDYSFFPIKLSAEGYEHLKKERESIRQEKGDEAAKEFISDEPKEGVIRIGDDYFDGYRYTEAELENGKTVYVALYQDHIYGYRTFGNRFREFTSPSGFSIVYIRRDPDGALLRQVGTPDDKWHEFIAAPPPDRSEYTAEQIEAMKNSWGYDREVFNACPF